MSLWYRIDQAVVATIVGLDITGSTAADGIGDKVFSRIWPETTISPCILVTEEGQVARRIGGTSKTKLYELPVVVWIYDSSIMHERKDVYMDWFDRIYDAFDQKRLAGVPEVQDCTIDVTPFLDRRLPEYQKIVMGMALRFQATKQRI